MYVIITYDINVKRVNKVKALLRRYLHWVQNSVFEGSLTEAKLEELKYYLQLLINPEEDSVVIYRFRTKPEVKREILGLEKNPVDEVI